MPGCSGRASSDVAEAGRSGAGQPPPRSPARPRAAPLRSPPSRGTTGPRAAPLPSAPHPGPARPRPPRPDTHSARAGVGGGAEQAAEQQGARRSQAPAPPRRHGSAAGLRPALRAGGSGCGCAGRPQLEGGGRGYASSSAGPGQAAGLPRGPAPGPGAGAGAGAGRQGRVQRRRRPPGVRLQHRSCCRRSQVFLCRLLSERACCPLLEMVSMKSQLNLNFVIFTLIKGIKGK